MNKIYALIPARSGSKSIKDKNILKLGTKSLLEWSIDICKKSDLIDRVFVSTDSIKYKNISLKAGAEVPYLRPKKISGDKSIDYDFVRHFIDFFKTKKELPTLILHIRPTTPLRSIEIIERAIKAFDNKKFSSLRSVHEMSESAYKMMEINKKGFLDPIAKNKNVRDISNNPRQNFPKTYVPNGYIDILSTKFIIKNKLLHGEKIMPFITPFVQEVDNMSDFEYLKYMLKNGKKNV